jgi:hypothetical protein
MCARFAHFESDSIDWGATALLHNQRVIASMGELLAKVVVLLLLLLLLCHCSHWLSAAWLPCPGSIPAQHILGALSNCVVTCAAHVSALSNQYAVFC